MSLSAVGAMHQKQAYPPTVKSYLSYITIVSFVFINSLFFTHHVNVYLFIYSLRGFTDGVNGGTVKIMFYCMPQLLFL